MSQESDTRTELVFGQKKYTIIGTAHVSNESVQEVSRVIEQDKPDRVCLELDAARFASLNDEESWKKLDIYKVIKEGKGFFMMAQLVLSSFQKRIGADTGVKPGMEMKQAALVCQQESIPFSLIDRDISLTLKRAWAKSSFIGKSKLLSALLGSAFSNEKVSAEDIEQLKKKSALEGMMAELSTFLPQVKTVLIDERDQYLACRLYEEKEDHLLAVVGAGHVPGMVRWLNELHEGKKTSDTSEIVSLPKPSWLAKASVWLLPALIVGLLVAGFAMSGLQGGMEKLLFWVLYNGGLAAIGTLLALGHPLTILSAFFAAPIATLNPFLGVGMVTGLLEAALRKPRVQDLESLQTDLGSLRGFYRNRVIRVLMVFVLSSIGGIIGNSITIFPGIAELISTFVSSLFR